MKPISNKKNATFTLMNSFPFSDNIVLENERVLLRPLEESDLQFLLPFAINEPDLWTYSLQSAGSAELMEAYIKAACTNRTQQKEYPFIVYDKGYNQYVGSTRFYDIQTLHATTQLGYTWYAKKFQGSGINANCKFLMLQFAFETLGMKRVEFRADANNARSIAAMKRIGCIEEGILRSNTIKADGGRRDSIVLSILQEEWCSIIKNKILRLL